MSDPIAFAGREFSRTDRLVLRGPPTAPPRPMPRSPRSWSVRAAPRCRAPDPRGRGRRQLPARHAAIGLATGEFLIAIAARTSGGARRTPGAESASAGRTSRDTVPADPHVVEHRQRLRSFLPSTSTSPVDTRGHRHAAARPIRSLWCGREIPDHAVDPGPSVPSSVRMTRPVPSVIEI